MYTAQLTLNASVNDQDYQYSTIILRVSVNDTINVLCFGSRATLLWYSSTGLDIPVVAALSPMIDNVFQKLNASNQWNILTIQKFSIMDVAAYTCRIDSTVKFVSESLFITDGNE